MLSLTRTSVVILLIVTLASSAGAKNGFGQDWPQWGGPQRDLVWRETGIARALPEAKDGLLPRAWSTPIAEGYAGPAVANGKVLVTDFVRQRRNTGKERVLCLDVETGQIQWTHEYDVDYTIDYAFGPRATPVIDSGKVYTIGAMGHMFCLDLGTGDVLWKKDFVEDFATQLPIWGMAASPLVVDDQLITLVGGKDALIVSFDKATGDVIWKSMDDQHVGYSPPMLFEFNGTKQIVCWHPRALSSLNPESGEVIWSIPFRVRAGLSIATPRKVGNRIFVSAFYDGPLMVEVTNHSNDARVIWRGKSANERRTDGVHCLMSTPFVDEENIFGVCSYGQLRGLETETGDRRWETFKATGEDRWWNAFIIPHEDRFFIHNEQGELIIARLTSEGYEELDRGKLIEPTRDVRRRVTIWSHPAFAQKSVFARNDKEIVRVNLEEAQDSED